MLIVLVFLTSKSTVLNYFKEHNMNNILN